MAPTVPTLTQAGFADHAGFYSGYRLTFMEEYGATPVVQTGTVTTVSGKVAFAGNLEQLELASWSGNLYFPSGSFNNTTTRSLATNVRKTVYSNSYGWLCQGVGSGFLLPEEIFATVTYYTAASSLVRTYDVGIGSASGSTIFRVGAGPMNLKALTSGQCQDGQAGSVNFPTAEGAYYTVFFSDIAGNLTVPFTYVIGPCERFNSQPVHFINKYGGIDSYTFTLKNRKRANITRQTYGYNSDVYATTTYNKVWSGEFDYVYALNSDWLTDAESEWLIEMIRSSQVWLELDGVLVEAIVNANTYQFTTRRNDRLTQLQVEVAVAYTKPYT